MPNKGKEIRCDFCKGMEEIVKKRKTECQTPARREQRNRAEN